MAYEITVNKVHGDFDGSYSELIHFIYDYQTNICLINIEHGHFLQVFFGIQSRFAWFIQYIHLIINIDSVYLFGKYLNVLMTVIGVDSSNKLVFVIFGVAEILTEESHKNNFILS